MAPDDSPSLQRPFRLLAALLAVGLVIAAMLAALGVNGPGLLTLEQAVFGLGVAMAITAIIIVVVLLRLGRVLEELRKVRAENRDIRTQLSASEQKQHVILLEGIGDTYAARLNQVGIITVPQLIRADAGYVGQQINVSANIVRGWQAMGQLTQIKGIGPQYAELLVKSGITTVAELARVNPAALMATIETVQDTRKVAIQKGEIGQGHVERWVHAASEHLNNAVTSSRRAAPAQRK